MSIQGQRKMRLSPTRKTIKFIAVIRMNASIDNTNYSTQEHSDLIVSGIYWKIYRFQKKHQSLRFDRNEPGFEWDILSWSKTENQIQEMQSPFLPSIVRSNFEFIGTFGNNYWLNLKSTVKSKHSLLKNTFWGPFSIAMPFIIPTGCFKKKVTVLIENNLLLKVFSSYFQKLL